MSKLKKTFALFLAAFLGLGMGAGISLAGTAFAQDISQSPVVVMFTRAAQVIAVWPRNDAFSVGSTTAMTPQGGLSALGVVLNYSGYLNGSATSTFADAFDVASTTATGSATTTTDLFRVNSAGCVNVVGTSTATAIKLTFNASTTQGSTNAGVVDFAYGKCSG